MSRKRLVCGFYSSLYCWSANNLFENCLLFLPVLTNSYRSFTQTPYVGWVNDLLHFYSLRKFKKSDNNNLIYVFGSACEIDIKLYWNLKGPFLNSSSCVQICVHTSMRYIGRKEMKQTVIHQFLKFSFFCLSTHSITINRYGCRLKILSQQTLQY